MKIRQRHLGFPALLLALGLSRWAGAASDWTDPTPADQAISEDPTRGFEGAVFLEKRWESTGSALRYYVRAKILSKAGFDVGTVDFLDEDAYDIEGRTVSASGRVTELKTSEIRTVTTTKTASVSWNRKGFTLPALEPGCFVEYRFTESGPLGNGGAFHVEILFQDRHRVLSQELRTPRVLGYSSRPRLQNGVNIELAEDDGDHVYRAKNAEPLLDEPYGLPRRERAAAVIFARVMPGITAREGEFWPEITKKGFVPYLEAQLVRPFRVAARLKSIPGSRAADPKARLRAIYDDVRSLRNRAALRFGEKPPKDGWDRNDDAVDTLANGSGNPHDLCGLFESLLRADGWKFRRVFLADREERFFHREIPSFHQLMGGEVVEVSDPSFEKPILVSFQHPMLPLGLVPWSFAGVSAWAVDVEAGKGEIVQVPLLTSSASVRHRTWELKLAEDGSATIRRTARASGYRAVGLRTELFAEGEAAVREATKKSWRGATPAWELESLKFDGADDPYGELSSDLTLTTAAFGSGLPGGRWDVAPLGMVADANPFTAETRKGPVIFDYTRVDEDDVIVHPFGDLAAGDLPKPVSTETSVGSYRVSAERREDGAILIHRRFELRRPAVAAENYGDVRRLFEAADREDDRYSVWFAPKSKGGR